MQRPELNNALSAQEFARWYWLKEELLMFCRTAGLSAVGLKPEIANRFAVTGAASCIVCYWIAGLLLLAQFLRRVL
jgi:SAP domain-containing new25